MPEATGELRSEPAAAAAAAQGGSAPLATQRNATMKPSAPLIAAVLCSAASAPTVSCFDASLQPRSRRNTLRTRLVSFPSVALQSSRCVDAESRRDVLKSAVLAGATALAGNAFFPGTADAAVGTLPEFADSNAIVQGVTVTVTDQRQQDQMIKFLSNGFDFEVLRKRIDPSSGVEDTWMGFGPEQLSTPDDFEIPVSSFAMNGGHASVHIRYDSQARSLLYKAGDPAPGDNIAFLQVGVPGYRISQMVAAGGNVLDAYGYVNVVSPCGLPMRGIVGISPDPMMMVAINCRDVQQSAAFYQQLGFVEQEYPYARLSRGQTPFEPEMPKKSVYMAPSSNCMGVLLEPAKKRKLTTNPVVNSLNIVYTPSTGDVQNDGVSFPAIVDPSGVPIAFQSAADFTKEEKLTR